LVTVEDSCEQRVALAILRKAETCDLDPTGVIDCSRREIVRYDLERGNWPPITGFKDGNISGWGNARIRKAIQRLQKLGLKVGGKPCPGKANDITTFNLSGLIARGLYIT
jgi:hypothetical protein